MILDEAKKEKIKEEETRQVMDELENMEEKTGVIKKPNLLTRKFRKQLTVGGAILFGVYIGIVTVLILLVVVRFF